MKRGRDEEKMESMFPILHVNDAEKGAPLRNNMAIYEQLNIPSQSSSHLTMPTSRSTCWAPSLPQGSASGSGTFFSRQLPSRHQPDHPSSHYNDFNNPSTQIEQREKLGEDEDEDNFSVPIFTSSFPSLECGNVDTEELSEGEYQKHEHSKEFVADRVEAVSGSLINNTAEYLQKQTESSPCYEPSSILTNIVDRLSADDISRPELCTEPQSISNWHNTAVSGENITETDKRDSPDSLRSLSSGDQNIAHDRNYVRESHENRSCGSIHARNLDRADNVSETSLLNSISGQNSITPDDVVGLITPDDVVGLIGQKHFWKARTTMANQQRIFSAQVFELHRLIKVQRLIAASPNLLFDDSAYLSNPIETSPAKKLPLEKLKRHSDKPSHTKEGSVGSAVEDTPFPSIQNGVAPLNNQPLSGYYPAPFVNSDLYPGPHCFNQQNSHQWLIPVMSPSEGLVYKPYPGPGFVDPSCGGHGLPGPIPLTGESLNPGYEFPVPPHGYFPPHGLPFMDAATFTGSFVKQMNLAPMSVLISANAASGPSENVSGVSPRSAVKGKTRLWAEASGSGGPTQVIKVVPLNARSETESAGNFLQSIQEERKEYDSSNYTSDSD